MPTTTIQEAVETRICPKCRTSVPLSLFARRVDGSISWCRPCINRKRVSTNKGRRIRAANEYLRRIRFSTPIDSVQEHLTNAAKAMGGNPKLSRYLLSKLNDPNLSEACRAARVLMLVVSAAAGNK